jgi:hypothetical protein
VIREDIACRIGGIFQPISEVNTFSIQFLVHLSFCPVYAVVVDDWLTIALALAATARITRLITLDTITEPIRARLPGMLGALVQCAWCTGVWVAVPVGLSWHWWADHTWWQVTALIAALSWFAGAVASAGMPSQHEVATIGPVALINADEPPAPIETNLEVVEGVSAEAIADRVVEVLRRSGVATGSEAASD